MVLDQNITKKIIDLVKLKPRTVQEISEHIKKNWRTAERYVEKIEEETGQVSTRIFRKGTRGALKVVYWNSIENIHSTSFQGELLEDLTHGKRTADFSPFDIYQYINDKEKTAFVEDVSKIDPEIEISEEQDLVGLLKKASKQILIFSGNLSWVNAKQGKTKITDVIKELIERNVSIKVIGRVSMIGADNAKKLLALNKVAGKDLIEIRHRYQPLRVMIIDDKIVRLRDIKEPEYYKPGELKKKIAIFYEIYEKEWIEWIEKVFWKMFSTGIPAEKRLKEIELIKTKLI
ncbi:Uncharacterised protein [uncultured archaeon]|nr:Uncharacterised protein [uncultured archaeon]